MPKSRSLVAQRATNSSVERQTENTPVIPVAKTFLKERIFDCRKCDYSTCRWCHIGQALKPSNLEQECSNCNNCGATGDLDVQGVRWRRTGWLHDFGIYDDEEGGEEDHDYDNYGSEDGEYSRNASDEEGEDAH